MGPYCQFCGQRCFVPLTQELWDRMTEEQRDAYRKAPTDSMATCPAGQLFEKEHLGVCYDELLSQQQQQKGDRDHDETNTPPA